MKHDGGNKRKYTGERYNGIKTEAGETVKGKTINVRAKGKAHPSTGHETPEVGTAEVQIYSFFNLVLEGVVGQSHALAGPFCPREKNPVSIVQEGGWASRSVMPGAENLAVTGIRSSDRPGYCESLYRLKCNKAIY
jgi:hypothetical protein